MESYHEKLKEGFDQSTPEWDDAQMWDNIEQTLPTDSPRRQWLLWFFSGLGIILVGLIASWVILTSRSYDESGSLYSISHSYSDLGEDSLVARGESQMASDRQEEIGEISYSSVSFGAIAMGSAKSTQDAKPKAVLDRTNLDEQFQSNSSAIQLLDISTSKKSGNQTTSLHYVTTVKSKTNSVSTRVVNQRGRINESVFLSKIEFILGKEEITQSDLVLLSLGNPYDSSNKNQKLKPRHSFVADIGAINTRRTIASRENPDWVYAKESREDILETIDFGIQYQRLLKGNIQVGIGLGYSQVNERLTWRDTIVAAQDTTLMSSIQVVETTYNTVENKTPNAFQTLYVPLNIGYLITKDKWLFSTTLGCNISLVQRHRGRFLTSELEEVIDNELNTSMINQSIGIQSLVAATSVAYQLTDRTYVSAGIRYQIGIANRLDSSSNTLKYGGYGLQLGLRYDL